MMEAGDYNLIPSLNNLYSPHPPHPKKNNNKEVNEIWSSHAIDHKDNHILVSGTV